MNNSFYSQLLSISKNLGLPIKKILDVCFLLHNGTPVENNKLVQKVGVSKNTLNQLKEYLSSFLKPASAVTQLTPDTTEIIKSIFKDFSIEEDLWKIFEGPDFKKIIALLKTYGGLRPAPKRDYDQFTATAKTTARRACLMNFFGDITLKRILFLGDDDFTSLAVASLGIAMDIKVLDIDKRILQRIRQIAQEKKYPIQVDEYDVCNILPDLYARKFDVVFTDPPYTILGMNLFLSRAIKSLDLENKAARIYICYGNSDRAKERYLPIYKLLIDSGLMIRWVFDKFNRYSQAESIGNSSTLFICDITPKTKELIKGNYYEKIYTNN